MDCEFFAVNHSIPDALAVAIRTPAGTVLHTGDIKLDQLPLDGRLTDLAGFSRLGDEGVDLFLVDSTNAEVPGFVTPSARSGRCWTACSTARARAGDRRLLRRATCTGCSRCSTRRRRTGGKVCFVGRSMVRNMGSPQDLGLLTVPDGLLVRAGRGAELIPDNRIVYVSTGSQGEPLSALSRMSRGEHRSVQI